jgi:hypothetical protein
MASDWSGACRTNLDIECRVRLPGGLNGLPDTAAASLKGFYGLVYCRFRFIRCRDAGVQSIQRIKWFAHNSILRRPAV